MDQQRTILPTPAQAPAGASVYAGFWIRLGAMIIDFLVVGIPAILLVMLLLPILGNLALVLVGTANILYYVLLHGRFGATVGKMAVGIRVVQLNGSPINYAIAAMRYSPFIVIGILGMVFPSAQFPQYLNLIYAIIAMIVLIANNQKRTVHDFIAKTVVLKKKPEGLTTVPAP